MDLIERCRGGDREAFCELFERYKNLVYRTAYLMLNDPDEADEVLQEVFVSMLHSLKTYQPEKSAFSTWLHRVTINRCLNWKRSLNLRALLHQPFDFFQKSGASSQVMAEDKESVRQALRRLSASLRTVIILRYYHDLSYTEIADILNVPDGTVKSRINLAHKKLRELLQPDYPDPFPLSKVKDELPTNS
jgi:RNA polymerase sigma-70 factor (ECF subfamily)